MLQSESNQYQPKSSELRLTSAEVRRPRKRGRQARGKQGFYFCRTASLVHSSYFLFARCSDCEGGSEPGRCSPESVSTALPPLNYCLSIQTPDFFFNSSNFASILSPWTIFSTTEVTSGRSRRSRPVR